MEERRKIANPFTPDLRPNNRQNLYSFTKKTTPTKRSKSDSKRESKKLHQSRKIEECYIPTKAAKPTFMSPAIVNDTNKT